MSTETTKKKIKIDNGTEFARVYTDKEVDSKLTNKQDTLVSGTNIKTLNGQSILGSGDLPISGGGGEIIDLNEQINLDNNTITQSGYNLIQQAYENNTLLGISFTIPGSANVKCMFDYIAIDIKTMTNIYCFKMEMGETIVFKIKSNLTIEQMIQSSCARETSFSLAGYEGEYVSSIRFNETIYKIPYTLIVPNKDKYQNEVIAFTNDTYTKTIYNIPTLPADASTKTYTLQAVNGVLTWTDAIGDINTILDNINGEVI